MIQDSAHRHFPGPEEKEVLCAGELHSLQAAASLCPVHEASMGQWTRRALSIFPRVAMRRDPAGCRGASADPGTAHRQENLWMRGG